MSEPFRRGDIVRGPSVHDEKVRTWRLLYVSEDQEMAAAQNVRARKPYRHALLLNKVTLAGKGATR